MLSSIDYLITNGSKIIKDTNFALESRQSATEASALVFTATVDSGTNCGMVRVDVDPTLDFRVTFWFRDAASAVLVARQVPPTVLSDTNAALVRDGKLMVNSRTIHSSSVALLDQLVERTRSLLVELSVLRVCCGALNSDDCSSQLKVPFDEHIDGVNRLLCDKLAATRFSGWLPIDIAAKSFVAIHNTDCLCLLRPASGSGRRSVRCEHCSNNMAQLFRNHSRDFVLQQAAAAADPPKLCVADAIDTDVLETVAALADPTEKLYISMLVDACRRQYGKEPNSTTPYPPEIVDLAGALYNRLGTSKYEEARRLLPNPLPTGRVARRWRSMRLGARPALSFVVEIGALKETFLAAADRLPLPPGAARTLVLRYCVLSFDGMKMRARLVAQRGRDDGAFAGTAPPCVAGQLVHSVDDASTNGQQVATSILTFSLRSVFSGVCGVVGVVPTASSEPTAAEIEPHLRRMTTLLDAAGFGVLCAVRDSATAHQRIDLYSNPLGDDALDLAFAYAEFQHDQAELARGHCEAAPDGEFGAVSTSIVNGYRAGCVLRARGGGRGDRAPLLAKDPKERAKSVHGGTAVLKHMSDLTAVMRISLPDATHAMKRVASDIRGEESDRRDVGVSIEWDGARYQFDVSTYSNLLHILNHSDDPEVLGPPLVHSRILSDAILRSRSRVEAMDPRKQRKYLGSGGTLLTLLNDLLSRQPELAEQFAGLQIFLREFAPGLEALTCGQSITAAALSQGGDVRAKLSRSRAFVECATFKAPLRADLLAIFDFWLTTVPQIFESAKTMLLAHAADDEADDRAADFVLQTVPWRWTQDWCEKVHGIFRSSAGSTDTPTITAIADTTMSINTVSSSVRAGVVRGKRQALSRKTKALKRKFKEAATQIVNSF